MPHRIFVSYSHKDSEFATRLVRSLRALGADVWIDADILPGEEWSAVIQAELAQRGLMILIVSPRSMASRHVTTEWQYFFDLDKPILPVLLEPAGELSYQIHRVQYANFYRRPYIEGLLELHAALRDHGVDLQPPPRETTVEGRDVAPLRDESPFGDPKLARRSEWPPAPPFRDPFKGWKRLRDIPDRLVGRRLGEYVLKERLNQGGTSEVVLAESVTHKRLVAIKWLKPQFARDPELRERFRMYYEVTRRFDHPNVVRSYDYGQIAGVDIPFIVMPYLSKGNLADRLEGGRLPVSDVLTIVEQVAGALDYAHRFGVLHGNLKPSHILFDRKGRAFVADLGFRAIFGGSPVEGDSAIYTTPEQVRHEPLEPTSDVYTLGLITFEMLVGHPPFLNDSDEEYRNSQLYKSLPCLSDLQTDLPRAMHAVLCRATRKVPAERYSRPGLMADALRQASLARTGLLSGTGALVGRPDGRR